MRISTLSLADFLVRTSAWRAEVPVLPEKEAASGSNIIGSSKKSSRNTRSSKMSQPFALADWTKCSGRSLRSGMMRNGIVYPLPPLAPLTKEIVSGSSPTWQTPVADDAVDRKNGKWNSRGEPKLSAQVLMWPTPKAHPGSNRRTKPTPAQLAGKAGMDLSVAVKLWPTPTAHNAKEGGYPAEHTRNTPTLAARAGGRLNPTWVEWLMGFPLGHTDLNSSETP